MVLTLSFIRQRVQTSVLSDVGPIRAPLGTCSGFRVVPGRR
jgi:hypothetical protein